MLFKRNPIKNLLLYILFVPFLFLGCEGKLSYKKLILTEASIKVFSFRELNSTLYNITYSLGDVIPLRERNYIPKFSNIEDEKIIQIKGRLSPFYRDENNTLSDYFTLICANKLKIKYIISDIFDPTEPLVEYISVSQLKLMNCLNSSSQTDDISIVYTANEGLNIDGIVSYPNKRIYTSNVIKIHAQEINEAFALFEEGK